MKKKYAHERKKNFDSWRVKTFARVGPTGIALLAEFLNWDVDSIDPDSFKAMDFRHDLLKRWVHQCTTDNHDWRARMHVIQQEIRTDIVSILHPSPLTAEEEVHETWSPRRTRLWHLLNKLASMKWHVHWRLEWDDLGRGAKQLTMEGLASWAANKFKLGADTFAIKEEIDGPLGLRGEIYGVLRAALKGGEIAKLRTCTNKSCGRFFVAKREKGEQCSEKCRNQINNDLRRAAGDFKKYYRQRMQTKIKRAKKMLGKEPTQTTIKKTLQQTGLSRKALERARLIDRDV